MSSIAQRGKGKVRAGKHPGVDFAQNVRFDRSGYRFRIIVFDRGSDAIGSLTIPDYENSRLVLPQLKSP